MPRRSFPRFFVLASLLLAPGSPASFCDHPHFELEWSDEFSGDELDTTKWMPVCTHNTCTCAAPFPTHAADDHGAECRSAVCVREGVSLDGEGHLVLTSERKSLPGSRLQNWTTGAVKTRGKAEWSTDDGTYRVCISAKLPGVVKTNVSSSQGLWPAHWMMPDDDSCDPDEGEMDIMEMVSGNGEVEATYHWQANWPATTCAYPDGHDEIWNGTTYPGTGDPERWWYEDFHEYAVERSATAISFAVDGVTIVNSSTYTNSSGDTKDVLLWPIPFYLILNSAVGGGWPGEPDSTTVSPAQHVIDYVRVVREKGQK